MASGKATVTAFTDAASGIQAFGAAATTLLTANTTAEGMQIQAQSTRIAAEGTQLEAEGASTEATNYTLAGTLAKQNAQYTSNVTALQKQMETRTVAQAQSTTTAGVAGAGFQDKGSALYLMKQGAQQGALAVAMIGQQGAITKAGFEEQSTAYNNLASYANLAATTQTTIAGQEEQLASSQDALASQIASAGDISAVISGISGVAKFGAAIASIFT